MNIMDKHSMSYGRLSQRRRSNPMTSTFLSVFLVSLFLLLNGTTKMYSQTDKVIYSTNFGTANGAVSTISGWTSSGAQAANLSISDASTSDTYTTPIAFSGNANLADGDGSPATGTAMATLAGKINTQGLSNIKVLYAARGVNSYTGIITFEWSSDGSTWYNITYADVTRNSTWAVINGGTWLALPPGAAGVTDLRFRLTFVRSNAIGNYRIDDFTVLGTCSAAFDATFAGGGEMCVETSKSLTATITGGGVSPYTFSLNNGGGSTTGMSPLTRIVSPTSNKEYTATVTDSRGCIATITGNTQEVLVNPIPTTPTTMDPSAVCFSTAVNVEGTGSNQPQGVGGSITQYTFWNAETGGTQLGATNVLGTISGNILTTSTTLAAGSYDVYIQAEGVPPSCPSVRKKVTITINPLPTLTGVSQAAPVCTGTTATINLTGLPNNSNLTISYTIDGMAQTPVNITSTGSTGSFSHLLTNAENGKVLEITAIANTSQTPNCATTFTGITTTITVNPLPTPTVAISETSGSTNNDGLLCAGASATLDAGSYSSYLWSTTATSQTISVSASGTYTVTVTDANGCQNAAAGVITINPLPTPTVAISETSGSTNNDGLLCAGASATLDAGAYSSYSWSTTATSQTISVSTSGTYTVTVTDGNGCQNSAAATITVNPLPTPVITGNLILNCANPSTTLSTTVPYSGYLWSTTQTSSTISVNTVGTFLVTVTDANGCVGTSPSVTTQYFPVTNTSNNTNYTSIQAAINAATTGNVIEVCSGTYSEQVLVNKEVTIKGTGATKPIINFTGTVAGKPTLIDISQPNVTIENLELRVDLVKLSSGIIASATNISNLTIKNNDIKAVGSTNAASSGAYGNRNAVSVNYGGSINYRLASGGVSNIVFQGNTVDIRLAADPLSGGADRFFRSGISLDEGGGSFTGNTLQSINHDILVRFASNGAVNISNNNLNGGGVEIAEHNAGAGVFTISGNTFDATFANAAAPGTAVLRLKNNIQSKTTAVMGNTFNNHQWAISSENYNSVTFDNNNFTPLANSTSYHHVVITTKSISSNSNTIVQVPISAVVTNNTFNGSGTAGGTAVTFNNHDSDNAAYGTFTLGTAGNENNFNTGIATFVTFDNQIGSTNSSTFPIYPTTGGWPTTMACWNQNLDARYNKFNVGAGLQLPTAMNVTQRTALENALFHQPDASCTGLITYFLPVHNLTQNTYFSTIQPAIAAAATSDVIELSEWTFNEAVTIDKPLTLQGLNIDKSLQVINGTGLGTNSGIKINTGITGVTIKNLTVQNFTGAGGNSNAGIYGIGGNNNLTVQNVALLNNTSASGFYANGPVSTVSITNSMVANNGSGARGIVIWNGLKQNITISNNTVTNNNCCGIELQDGTASNVNIIGNTINIGGGDNAIGLNGLNSNIGPNLISGNMITGGGRFGIELKMPDAATVSNNTITLSTLNADLRDRAGIAVIRRSYLAGQGYVNIPNGVTLSGNTISGYIQVSNSKGFGIVVEGTNHTVTNNTISGCDIGIQQQAGHTPYTGTGTADDGDQTNVADLYFGRGNSPTLCNVTVSGNTFGVNGVNQRIVIGGGTGTIVTTTVATVDDPTDQVLCNGATTTLVTFTGNNLPGVIYKWANNEPTIGLAASGTSPTIPSFTATNNTSAPIIASITVTPSVNNCDGTPQTFTITVNPTPTVDVSTNQVVCNNAMTSAITFGSTFNVSGTTYTWTNTTPSIGLVTSGTGNIAAFAGVNTTNAPIVATIVVTPHANGCDGTPQTFTITVNPTPTVDVVSNQAVCNGTMTSAVTFSSAFNVSGTTYTWTNNTLSIGLGASGTGGIAAFAGVNTTNAPIIATIVVTPHANGCDGSTQTFTITVNPTPTVNVVSNQTVCNGTMTSAITFSSTFNVSGTTYTWTNNTPSIGLDASGTGGIAAFAGVNTTNAPIIATIVVTPHANGCDGTTQTFTITVNPTPTVDVVSNQAVCNGTMTSAVTFGSAFNVSGTTYTWTNNITSIGLAASGTGNIAAFTGVNTTNAPIIATIVVTPHANGCDGPTQTFTITVNPTPVVTPILGQSYVYVGNPITLTNATVGGVWSTVSVPITAASIDNAGVLTGYTTGTTTVSYTVTDVNGCVSTATKIVSVNLPLFDIGIFNEPSGSDKLVVKIRPTAYIDAGDYTGGVFTVRVPTANGVSLSISSPIYSLSTSEANVLDLTDNLNYNYYAFSSAGDPSPINMNQGQWYDIAMLQHSGSCAGTGTFTLVTNDAWTNTHNGNYFQELFSQPAQRFIDVASAMAPLDVVAPTALCQPTVTVNLSSPTLTTAMVDNGSTDACAFTLSLSKTSFTCADIANNATAANLVTMTVKDATNNESTCTTQVTVVDNVAPTATCTPNITVNLSAPTITAAMVNNGSTDNCTTAGSLSLSIDKATFACADILTNPNTVTLTVTDAANNASTCTAAITVVDNVPPTITAPADITVAVNAASCSATTTLTAPATSDNCTVASVTNNAPSVFSLGNTTVTWTVTDAAGNTATTMQVVTVTTSLAATAITLGSSAICTGNATTLSFTITGGLSPYTVVYNVGSTPSTEYNYVSGTPLSISPTITTTYTLVSVTDAFGCIIMPPSLSATLTVNPVPTLSITQPTPVCVGLNLDNVVKGENITGGTFTYHATLMDADNNTAPLSGTSVTNASVNTYVRYTLSTGCYVTGLINITTGACVEIEARIALQGPYDVANSIMKQDLRTASLIPLSDPYSTSDYNTAFVHVNGDGVKTVTQTILNTNAIVDWVFVELRHKTTKAVVATRSGLLQSDGDIVDVNGTSSLRFLANYDDYYLVVRHRNHLGVMTAAPVSYSASMPASIDFTSPATAVFTNPALASSSSSNYAPRKVLSVGKLGLWAGNANISVNSLNNISYNGSPNDRASILSKVGSTTPLNIVVGYHKEDINMNGFVSYNGAGNDRAIILGNIGSSTPNNIIVQHFE